MIELKDLEHVATIKRAGGIQKAAKALGLSQPALTKRLQNLEARIGMRLFDRQAKGVKLTQAGRMFLADGERLLSHARDFSTKISAHKQGQGGRVAMGVKAGMEDAFFRRSLVEFVQTYPDNQINVSIDATPGLSRKVQEGELDFAIGALGYFNEEGIELVLDDALEFQPLFEIPLVIFLRKDHPVLPRLSDPMSLFDYPIAAPTPPQFIWDQLKQAYAQKGQIVERPHTLIENYALIYDVVARTDHWSATFASSHHKLELTQKFQILPPLPQLTPLTIGMVKRKTWSMTPAARNLMDIIYTHAAEWRISTPD